ncbi:IS3 family transposase [Carnobacteriaceae bacterium zg-ZUI252]|nr:IS3 family transposase [Carnobacteriaceae bacterium zg-ZUI252]MBS4770868.1 IS3 family transposase [Carnobacteriaceae bacterium zg-ZUI240]
MTRRARRSYTPEFKQQMVELYRIGSKSRAEITREYDITPSAFDRWIKHYNQSGSFKEADNRTAEETELRRLKKENQQLKMENDIFKASGADNGTKIAVIHANRHKYSVSAMCNCLKISRSTYYYAFKAIKTTQNQEIEKMVIQAFNENRKVYGARKLKHSLSLLGLIISRRRIRRIMNKHDLVSVYTHKKFKPSKTTVNNAKVENVVNRSFNDRQPMEVVVSDLTYVRVGDKWHYICVLIDLFNREIIGHSTGPNKDATLVKRAFQSIPYNIGNIQIFHTDRGSEFDNKLISQVLDTFEISRSMSAKGTSYDNAVAEASFKAIKTEFVHQHRFESLKQLEVLLHDYVYWWNNRRIHSGIDYCCPIFMRHAEKLKDC